MKRIICMVMAMLAAGMAMGATRLVPRLLVLESASVGEKTWIYRTLEQGSIVKGESRGDYPAWNFMHWERRIHIARWQMASIRFQILAVRWTGPQSVSQTVPHWIGSFLFSGSMRSSRSKPIAIRLEETLGYCTVRVIERVLPYSPG